MIKAILDELKAESSSNAKIAILKTHADNELLKRVLYMSSSRRVKFYIKQIPEYQSNRIVSLTLTEALDDLKEISERELTGFDAINYLRVILESLTENDANVLERVVTKDIKIGMGTTNINKVFPKLVEKTAYMGARPHSDKLVDKLFEIGSVISDVKMDGRYCNAIIRSGEVDLESRQGEITHVGDCIFMRQLSSMPDCVLNGELTIKEMDRYEANGVIASIVDIEKKREIRTEAETNKKLQAFVRKHGDYQDVVNRIIYTVWDVITIDEYFSKKSSTPYIDRRVTLVELIEDIHETTGMPRVNIVESTIVGNKEIAVKHFQEALARGLEGTILKSLDGEWKDGKPTTQIKMKLEINLDLKIVGFQYGTKGTKNEHVISTLNVESSCGLLKTNPAGMDESMMAFVTENQEALVGTIVEIRCCGLSTDSKGNWSTLHPSIVKLRDDKDAYDSLESAQAIENASKTLS